MSLPTIDLGGSDGITSTLWHPDLDQCSFGRMPWICHMLILGNALVSLVCLCSKEPTRCRVISAHPGESDLWANPYPYVQLWSTFPAFCKTHHCFVFFTELELGLETVRPSCTGEVILFGREQPLGEVLRTGLAPTDFVGRRLWLSIHLRIQAKGLCQPPPGQKGQGVGRRQATEAPSTMREENCQSWTKNVGVILLDLRERWTGNSSDTVRLFSPPWWAVLAGGLLNRTKFQFLILIFMKGDAGKLFKIKNKSFNKETSYVASQKAFA